MVARGTWAAVEGFESHIFYHEFNKKGDEIIEEIYEWIPGYEGMYKVSNCGDVVSFKHKEPRSIYQTKNNCGYMQVKLCKNNREKRYYVHRLVAMRFVPGYSEDKEVNHKDFDKTNNTYKNLEWVTKSENHKHIIEYNPEKCSLYKGDKRIKRCVVCGAEIDHKAMRCKECSIKYRRRNWPSESQLRMDLLTMNFCEIGRKYNCSYNNIRRMCRVYGLPTTTSGVELLRNGPVAQR